MSSNDTEMKTGYLEKVLTHQPLDTCFYFKLIKILVIIALGISTAGIAQKIPHPNVIIILTDDQGYGDLGITGNTRIKTPVIDEFARTSIRFRNFHVSPVCAPTRASLMTGRYSLRTGIRDTYNGGAMMASDEITIAEMLKPAGYTSGIFGKWHLGDNYPFRPNDQGFDESLIHLAGGIGQVGDVTTYFERDSSYFNPVLWRNGNREAYEGYCSDIFAEGALNFIEKNKDSPFFCYLSFNAPHRPLQVPGSYYELYADIDPSIDFERSNPFGAKMSEKDKEDARKVYAMVTNIDENTGKILRKLNELGIAENTIVIFMTDNGPQQLRYNTGMRGRKGNVFRGGIRVPFFLKYPAKFDGDQDIETTTAHIDILPTIAQLCDVAMPKDRIIDGKSLVPLMNKEKVNWTNRSLFFYWSRRYPELYNNMALQKGDYKLVGRTNYDASIEDFELFSLKRDPYEQRNVVRENKEMAATLKSELDRLYHELVISDHLIHAPRIAIGTEHENPLILNRNDATGERGIWDQEEIHGKWKVGVEQGRYHFRFRFIQPVEAGGKMLLETGTIVHQMKNEMHTDLIEMNDVILPQMDCELIPFYSIKGRKIFPLWVEVERVR